MQVNRSPLNADGAWENMLGAIGVGGDFATRPGNAIGLHVPLGTKLLLNGFSEPVIGDGNEIVGIQILIRARKRLIDEPSTSDVKISVAPTKDGVFIVGTPAEITLTESFQDYVRGSNSHLWDSSWSLADVNSQNFGLMVIPELLDASWNIDVDHAEVTVFYNESGDSFTDMSNLKALQAVQIGKETTPGTAVAATIKLLKTKFRLNFDGEFKKFGHAGQMITGQSHLTKDNSTIDVEMEPTYDEIGFVYGSQIGKPITQSAGSIAKRHVFTKRVQSVPDPLIFTIEDGTPVNAKKASYGRVTQMQMTFNAGEVTASGSGIAKALEVGATMTAGANEVQTMTVSGTGTFKLKFDGHEQSGSALNAASLTSSAIATALNSCASALTNGFAVTGTGPYVVTAQNGLAGKNIPMIEVIVVSGSPTVTLAETTQGGMAQLDGVPILPGQTSVYIANTVAGLSSGKLGALTVTEIDFGDAATGRHTVDRAAGLSFSKVVDTEHEMSIQITVDSDSVSKALIDDLRADKTKFVMIESVGTQIEAGVNHLHQIVAAVQFQNLPDFDDGDDIVSYVFDFVVVHDQVWGNSLQVTLVNKVASY